MRNSYVGRPSSEVDLLEPLIQPNLVDIIDFCKNKINADPYSSLKPSLKPLKWTKKKNNAREADVALEVPQKKIIYIQTFNHVKNEPIVFQAENKTKSLYNFANEVRNVKQKPNNKKNQTMNLDSQIALTFFKMNKEKFNPLKQIKRPSPQLDNKLEDNSTLKEFEFLTGVNLQGVETYREEQEEEAKPIYEGENMRESLDQLNPAKNNEPNHIEQAQSPKEANFKNYKEQEALPIIKKSAVHAEQPFISVSEARYKNFLDQKPKMYISFKTNSVQPYGKPATYKDHLERVFNKESTPTVAYPLINTLGPKKDYRKAILDTYLSQFNIEALKDIDEALYEYAKQKGSL